MSIITGQSTLADGNMSFSRGNPSETIENRRQYFQKFGLSLENLAIPHLDHTNTVRIVDNSYAGEGAYEFSEKLNKIDGLITSQSGLILAVTTADCLPVYLWSEDESVIGIAHAGWKGLASGIVKNLIINARQLKNVPPSKIHIKIGVGICPECYVVDVERLKQFLGYHLCEIHYREDEKVHLNLTAIASGQAQVQGVPPWNIDIAPGCTACGNIYPSYRRDKENFRPDIAFIVKTT